MARTYSSVTFYCLHDCGTSITFHRDDHLPTAPWECEACLDAAIEQQVEELSKAADRLAEAELRARLEWTGERPIARVAFPDGWPRTISDKFFN